MLSKITKQGTPHQKHMFTHFFSFLLGFPSFALHLGSWWWPLPSNLYQIFVNCCSTNTAGVCCSRHSRNNSNKVFKDRCSKSTRTDGPPFPICNWLRQVFMPVCCKMTLGNYFEKSPISSVPVALQLNVGMQKPSQAGLPFPLFHGIPENPVPCVG